MGSKPRKGDPKSAASDPQIPGHQRAIVYDERLAAKPPKKNYWEKRPRVFDKSEAGRMFSPSMRGRRALRSIGPDLDLLKQRRLPRWKSEADVAKALELSRGKLRWLANHRLDDAVSHYIRFRVAKRSGGHRVIMAPKRELKAVQRRLLAALVAKLPMSEHAHGFITGRSIATNARAHVGAKLVLRFDIEDFFGSVTFARVRGYLIAMGYGFEVATNLALLCTEAERQPVDDGERVYHVPIGHRSCVQGAPTSPALCNALVARLDRRLAGLAAASDFAYTRYADDMTFSGNDPGKAGTFLRAVSQIVSEEGFRLNRKKTLVMRAGRRQRVAGVVVNDTMGLSRKDRRRLRARLHQLGTDSPPDEIAKARGALAYLRMLNPAQAAALWPTWMPQPR